MSKLRAPLFSFRASGQIAKSLVYFGWKGLNLVRSYVVPSNPQTDPQVAHRAFLTAAVAMIHTAQARASNALTSADQVAYAALASLNKTPRTWFNEAVKFWVNVAVALKTSCVYSNIKVDAAAVGAITINGKFNEETPSDLADGKLWFGSSKTNLIHSSVATISAGDGFQILAKDLSAFLTAGIKYYFQFRPDVGDLCEGANSGIYYFVAE